MDKEYDVIEVGYIGSFIDERADNDGYDLKKSISLGVPDNNVWVVNPLTGVLESVISKGDSNDPQFVQFNGTKPTKPSTDLVIKYIGKTIKVINTFYTEVCVSESFSGSNYTYETSPIPEQYRSCEKSIYFTSNNMIQWPTMIQTNEMLSELSKKIPYDIGFSKRTYKIGKLSHEELLKVQKETKVSYDFLKNLSCLFLFDSEYPNDLEYSNIKLGFDWDGFSIDKNDANNLVYSDYHKKTNVENTKYVFLVTDRHIEELQKYFKEEALKKPTQFQTIDYYNPTEYIKRLRAEPPKYGAVYSFIPKGEDFFPDTYNQRGPNLDEILNVITKQKIYNIDPLVNDFDLIEDISIENFFTQVKAQITISSLQSLESQTQPEEIPLEELYDQIYEGMIGILSKYSINDAFKIDNINGKFYELIRKYILFQKKFTYPEINTIVINRNEFGGILLDNPFKPNISENLVNTPIAQAIGNNETTEINSIPAINSKNFTFKNFDFATDYSISDQFYKTKPLFLAESDRTSQFFSVIPNQKNSKYYISVYNRPTSDIRSIKVFDIAYAHINGSGSSYKTVEIQTETDHLPAKSIYKKYMAECFGGAEQIKFKNGNVSDYFYVLQFDRNTFKDKLNSGNIQITLSPISSSSNQLINTGSNFQFNVSSSTVFTLIDDSMYTRIYSSSFETTDECYNLVSGTIQDGPIDYENAEGWGLVFPNKGLIILNGEMLDASCSLNTVTASIDGDNPRKLFLSISGSCSPNAVRNNHGYWYMRSAELYADENYFCRINRNEFNYSNNYTYVTGSNSKVYYDKLNNTTKTYVTTIGLYNNLNELIAIGKFSRPFLKDSSQEYVINVKFRYT